MSVYTDHIKGLDIHANRPAANTVPPGALYSCSTHGLIYRSDGTAWQTWASLAGSYTDPLTTKGDLVARTASASARLGVGADGTILQADSATTPGVKWALPPEQVLYDAKGDILIGTANDARAKLGVGSDGQVLTADSTVSPTGLKWATPTSGGMTDPTTTKGDLIVRGASAIGRKAVGADGTLLTADSTQADGTAWSPLTSTRTINAQTGTSYTAVLADAARVAFLTMTNAAASTFTIPPNSSVAFPVGSVIEGAQMGAGQVTITPGSGVTINGTPGLKVAAQYGTFGLLKTATDTWLAYGRLSA